MAEINVTWHLYYGTLEKFWFMRRKENDVIGPYSRYVSRHADGLPW